MTSGDRDVITNIPPWLTIANSDLGSLQLYVPNDWHLVPSYYLADGESREEGDLLAWDATNQRFGCVDYINSALAIGQAASAAPCAVLELDSASHGFLPPRMTSTQKGAIASVVAGLSVYDSTLNRLDTFEGSAWAGGYLAMSGRSGGQSPKGGSAAGEGLSLYPNAEDSADSGTSTAIDSTKLTDSAKSWVPDEYIGGVARTDGKFLVITDSTETELIGAAGWRNYKGDTGASSPSSGETYRVALAPGLLEMDGKAAIGRLRPEWGSYIPTDPLGGGDVFSAYRLLTGWHHRMTIVPAEEDEGGYSVISFRPEKRTGAWDGDMSFVVHSTKDLSLGNPGEVHKHFSIYSSDAAGNGTKRLNLCYGADSAALSILNATTSIGSLQEDALMVYRGDKLNYSFTSGPTIRIAHLPHPGGAQTDDIVGTLEWVSGTGVNHGFAQGDAPVLVGGVLWGSIRLEATDAGAANDATFYIRATTAGVTATDVMSISGTQVLIDVPTVIGGSIDATKVILENDEEIRNTTNGQIALYNSSNSRIAMVFSIADVVTANTVHSFRGQGAGTDNLLINACGDLFLNWDYGDDVFIKNQLRILNGGTSTSMAAGAVLQIDMPTSDLEFHDAEVTKNTGTADGYIKVEIGGAVRYIQTYSDVPA